VVDGLARSKLFPTSPPHHSSRFGQATFDDFVPTNHLLALRIEEMFHLVDEPSLQFFFGLQPVLLHACLAIRTLLPIGLFHFVTADVYIFIREQLDKFGINILAEFEG